MYLNFTISFVLLVFTFRPGCGQNAYRIITAGSAITEVVFAIGLGPHVVATDRTSLYPPEAKSLPSIGYRTSISAEGIIGLQPTLFIVEKNYVDEAVITQIQSAGITVVKIDRTYSFEGTKNMIRQVAGTLQKNAAGEKLIAQIDKDLADAKALIKKSDKMPRVLCVYNRGALAVDIAGSQTFSSIVEYAGAENAFKNVNGFKALSAEALVAANPDYLVFFESGYKSLGGEPGVLKIPGVMQTTAGIKKHIIVMDGVKLSNFGPRLGEAVKELVGKLYGASASTH